MKTKLSPGPWELGIQHGIKTPDGRWLIKASCTVFANDETESTGPSAVCSAKEDDAKAISAVPEMISVLQEAYAELKEELEFNGRGGEWDLLTKIEAALKKAGAI